MCGWADGPDGRVADVRMGDTIHLTVRVRNPTGIPVTVSGASSTLLAFRALGAEGHVVAGSDRVGTMDLISRAVPPRGSISRTIVWNGNEASGFDRLAMLPAGDYRVIGVLNATQGEQVSPPRTVRIDVP